MCDTLSNFRVSCFRHRGLVWITLFIFSCSFLPSISFAQQPTATISALSGTVLVNGQQADRGAVLNAGDMIETQAGATVELTLPDGSTVKLGEKTQVEIKELTQTATGARISSLTLLVGWVRAFLSPEHQQAGSAFTITTPNARIDATFSEPDIEVSYNAEKAETVGIAHTVELLAKNLVTDEETMIPVGSMAIISAVGIKVVAGAATAGAVSAEAAGSGTTSTATTSAAASEGMGTGTKVAIGVGAVVAAGGVVAVAASSGDGNGGDGDGDGSDGDGDGDTSIDVSRWADCSQTHTVSNSILMYECEMVGGFTLGAGRSYWVMMEWGFPVENSEAEAREQQSQITLSVTMNGATLPMDGGTAVQYNPGAGWWEVVSYHCTGILDPGSYTLTGYSDHTEYGDGGSPTCVLTVQ